MKISVRTLMENCLTLEDGRRLYQRIVRELSAGRMVELDFSGIGAVSATFFNASLGFLLRDYEVDNLSRLIKMSYLAPDAKAVLKRVVDNCKRYYQRE